MTVKVLPLPGKVLVSEIENGERKIGSIVLTNDNGKGEGIRTRWAKVYAVGEGVTEIVAGEWILVEHGRWSRKVEVTVPADQEPLELHQVDDPNGVLVASDKIAFDTFAGESTIKSEKLRRD